MKRIILVAVVFVMLMAALSSLPVIADDKDDKLDKIVKKLDVQSLSIDFFGTDYHAGDSGTLWLQLLDDFIPILNSSCFVSAYYPNKTVMLDDELMYFLEGSDGLYYYDFVVPSELGVYMLSAICYVPETALSDRFSNETMIESSENITVTGGKAILAQYCGGTASQCSGFSNSTSCTSQSGCSWFGNDTTNYSVTLNPIEDTRIHSAVPTTNYCNEEGLVLQKVSTGNQRSLLIYDLSGIPSNAVVTSVSNDVYYYYYLGTNPSGQTTEMDMITSSWSPCGVTWNTQPSYTTVYRVQRNVPASYGWMRFNNTEIVQGWINGSYANNGFMFKFSVEGGTTNYVPLFRSVNYTGNTTLPSLTINYTVTGICNGTADSCSLFNLTSCTSQVGCSIENYTNGHIRSIPVSLGNFTSWNDFDSDYTETDGASISFKVLDSGNDTLCSALGSISSCAGSATPVKLDAVLSSNGTGYAEIDRWWITRSSPIVEELRGGGEFQVSAPVNVSEISDDVIIKMLKHARILNDRIVNFHNHQYCIDNLTLQHNITYEYCIDSKCELLSDIMDEECTYGCDTDNDVCLRSPTEKLLISILIVVVLFVVYMIYRWWHQ